MRRQCQALKHAHPAFPSEQYAKDVLAGIESLELKERVIHMANCLHKHLLRTQISRSPFAHSNLDWEFKAHAIPILSRCAQAGVFPPGESQDPHPAFAAWPLIDYVGMHGLDCPEESLPLLAELTHLFTAEFAIRPFALKHFDLTHHHALIWCGHENEHVRRLASEGLRPRLPWGLRIQQLCKDPSPLFPILDKLKADTSLYVRKSVANSINDISKDHPDIVIDLCRSWLSGSNYSESKQDAKDVSGIDMSSSQISDHTKWIIKHGTRTLVKQGKPEALLLFGCNAPVKIICTKLALRKVGAPTALASPNGLRRDSRVPTGKAEPLLDVRIGDSVEIEVEIVNEDEEQSESIILDFAVHYARSENQSKSSPPDATPPTKKTVTGKKRQRQTEEANAALEDSKRFRKVFKLASRTLEPNFAATFSKTVSFRPISTRKYYAGRHTIDILLNGKVCKSLDFILRD